MKTTLLIARHGNTFGPKDVVRRVGTTDLPLVESGLLQGYKLGAFLKQEELVPDVIFSSQLKRAVQTAQEAQRAMDTVLPIETLTIFNEIDYGLDENRPEEEVVARIGKTALADWEKSAIVPEGWKVDPLSIIENWHSFSERLLQDYAGKTILVVTSNGIARFAPYLTGNFEAFTTQHSIKISTGGFAIFEHLEGLEGWECLRWNVRP